jgi:hypothetical protein
VAKRLSRQPLGGLKSNLNGDIHLLEKGTYLKNRLNLRIGFWSSLMVAFLGLLYLAVLCVQLVFHGATIPPPEPFQSLASIITLLTVCTLVIVMSTIYSTTETSYEILGRVALAFTTLFAGMVSINRFIQLSVIRNILANGNSDNVGYFLPYGNHSITFALEILGWGFFFGLAALFIAPSFRKGLLDIFIRWLFILYGLLGFICVVGYAGESPISAVGFIAWGPVLLAISILLTVRFYHMLKNT